MDDRAARRPDPLAPSPLAPRPRAPSSRAPTPRAAATLRAPAALAALFLAATPGAALDCARAGRPLDAAICADPGARAADAAMASAFTALRALLDDRDRAAVLDDQRAWLKERDAACTGEARPAACARERNAARALLLAGRPETGPGLDPPPRPVFLRQAAGGMRIGVAVQVYRFADPGTPGARALNAWADRTLARTERTKPEPDDREWSRDESWSIAYASPAFLSILRTTYEYSGGAHGMGATGGLNIDLRSGRVLTSADLFDPAGARAVTALCLAQVRAQKTERGAGDDGVFDVPGGVRAVVGDLGHWSFTDREARIGFDQYAVGSYAEGPYVCTLPLKAVNAHARRALPLE